ncbi:MAG: MscS family membrane protein [Candidatus Endobugula sp.]|jgi:MscS family membrane protein
MSFIDQAATFFLSSDGWVLQVFLVVIVVLGGDLLQRKIIARLIKHAEEKTANIWDDAFFNAMRRPISLVLWVLALNIISRLVESSEEQQLIGAMAVVSHIGIIVAITWFVTEFIRHAQHKLISEELSKSANDESRIDRVTIEALCKLFRLAVIITAGIVLLETLGFSISGVLAFGGIGGIAIGFAAKDLLSNFFGGLMIYLDRPFAVGDWVRSNDRDIEGTVEYIGWRQTRIRTFAKRPIYVPNSIFSTIVVENPSRMSHRRIKEVIGVRYDDMAKVHSIVEQVKTMLQQHPEIDSSQTLIVNFDTFGPSSVDFFIYTFTKTVNWIKFHEVKQDVLLQIANIIEAHGAEFAFPTSTLHLYNETPKLAELTEQAKK